MQSKFQRWNFRTFVFHLGLIVLDVGTIDNIQPRRLTLVNLGHVTKPGADFCCREVCGVRLGERKVNLG